MKLALKGMPLNIPDKSDSSFEMNIKLEELLFTKKDKIKQKLNPTKKKEKYQNVLFAILKCTGQSNALID